jgi:hypothetical protein
MVSQIPAAARPAVIVTPRMIGPAWPPPTTPVSAFSAVPVPPPAGPVCARPAPPVGVGVTLGNRCATLPGLPTGGPGTVPRGSAGGVSGPLRAEVLPANLVPLGEGDGLGEGDPLGDGEGDGDGLGDGDPLGDGEGDGDPLGDGEGDGDPLGDGEGEGDWLGDGLGEGDGDPAELLGEGDGDPVAAAPVLPRTARSTPAATAAPPMRAHTLAHGRARIAPPRCLPASPRVRLAGVITAAWTRHQPQRFPEPAKRPGGERIVPPGAPHPVCAPSHPVTAAC